MQFAEGNAVADNRFSLRVAVASDVCRVEQFLVAQAAKSTSLLVCTNNPFAKDNLMHALANGPGDIGATSFRDVLRDPVADCDGGQCG